MSNTTDISLSRNKKIINTFWLKICLTCYCVSTGIFFYSVAWTGVEVKFVIMTSS